MIAGPQDRPGLASVRRAPTFAAEWAVFEQAIDEHGPVGDVQRREMRRAFYGGAYSLLVLVMETLDPGAGVTASDMDLMRNLSAELTAFAHAVVAGKA